MTVNVELNYLVIDVGKTHAKIHVLDEAFVSIFSKEMNNVVELNGKYPSINVSVLWAWIVESIKDITKHHLIRAISVTTHGATVALINRNSRSHDGLVLPILDYEYIGLDKDTSDYYALRTDFNKTYSPNLPGGLNVGRQLYWLKKIFAAEFAKTTDILMFPQYWCWRFTGQRYSEITSLGCHTDLWSLEDRDYSSLVDRLKCRHLFPPQQPAWHDCGEVLPELRAELGLASHCRFFNGIHDSNASFLRYRLTQGDVPFCVVSTGTWTVSMATQVSLDNLQEHKDMLANIDATGRPIACARFMGGREFEAICQQTGSWFGAPLNENDVQQVIEQQVFALADFSNGSGPFGGRESGFVGEVSKVSGKALATLYCALMIDNQLELLAAQGNIFIEGAFLKNPILCAVLNQLRPEQNVFMSKDHTGTVQGVGCLMAWGKTQPSLDLCKAKTTELIGLSNYKLQWQKLILEG